MKNNLERSFKLVLLRHGESLWNRENRFTGWTDVDLSETGINEALEAGNILKNNGLRFDLAYTSLMKRAIKTLNLALEELNQLWLEVKKDWRINERHYGRLQGLNKAQTAEKYGEDQVKIWRRSYETQPPEMSQEQYLKQFDNGFISSIQAHLVPKTESLKDTVVRVEDFYKSELKPGLEKHKNLLVVAHGNSMRALIKILDNLTSREVVNVEIPTGKPLIYEFKPGMQIINKYYLQKNRQTSLLNS